MPAGLRDAVREDAPALARIHHAARAAVLPGLRERWSEAEVAAWLAGTLMAEHRVRVAEVAGAPVGYAAHGLDAGRGPMVFHLYLSPAWHRQGIGSALLREALAAYAGRLSLVCLARNAAARAFYEKHGFRVVAQSDGAGTEEGEPDLLYAASPHSQNRTGEPP